MACPAVDARAVLAMASDTIRHVGELERRNDFAHRLNLAMASLTRNILHDMRLMVEVDKIREDVHPRPPDRLFFIPCFADLLDFGLRCRNKLVATHAGLHRGNHRSLPSACAAVAILTAHLVVAGVNLMAESDRLTRLEFRLFAAGKDDKDNRSGKNKL